MLKKKNQSFKKGMIGTLSATLLLSTFGATGALADNHDDNNTNDPATVDLRVMETTDIHVHLADYDYYSDQQTEAFGLVRTAQLIYEAREEATNSVLFDNGDLIQGNPMGDYVATVDPLQEDEIHPVYKLMNAMQYDAGNLGNHEFDYGLDFLHQSLEGSDFPYVNANVYEDDGTGEAGDPMYDPYVILERQVTDRDGNSHNLNIGVIGFVPPQITDWNRDNLEGKVVTKDIVESAEKYIPEMQADSDIIVAIPHSGFGSVEAGHMVENATYDLTHVDGIDAIMFGHDHAVFPGEQFADIEGVDLEKGTINGVPSVMPGKWGERLGFVDMELEVLNGEWTVTDARSETRGVVEDGEAVVERDEELFDMIRDVHESTLEYIRGPVGETTADINSYFSQIMDDPSIQIVTDAQTWYVENYMQGTEYDGVPVLSAGAPFKAGTRGDPNYYTDVQAGTIAIRNVADLYLYDNTLQAVYINGDQVKEWLEMSAAQFNQIDPDSNEPQDLVDMDFRSYNFDVIDGVNYEIDVTEPVRYNPEGDLINADANRIKNLEFEGEAIGEDDYFIVATNNYRASGGGNFPDIDEDVTVLQSPDENRQVIIEYIRELGTIDASADMNWNFAPIESDVNVVFESSPRAERYAENIDQIDYQETLDSGFAVYSLDMANPITEAPEPVAPVKTLPDVEESDYGYTAIRAIADKGIIEGFTDGTFRPGQSVTRAEAATMLTRALELDEAEADFADVDADAWYAGSAGAMQEADIFVGNDKKEFMPKAEMTRAETAAVLVRAFSLSGSSETAFEDIDDSIFKTDIEILLHNEITSGISANEYGTNHELTRRDLAIFLYRITE